MVRTGGVVVADVIVESLEAAIRDGDPLADYFVSAGLAEMEAVRAAVERGVTDTAVAELVEDARQRIRCETERSPLAILRQCTEGCTACCHNIGADVTAPEVLAMAGYLSSRLGPGELEKLQDRLQQIVQRRGRMTASQRRETRMRCGLLGEDRRCIAYDARPLACTGALSFSRSACELALRRPEALSDCVPMDAEAKVWTMGISGGLQRALSEAGLDGNLYELHSALLRALATPRAVARWAAGEDIFLGCECTDPHSWPRAGQQPTSGSCVGFVPEVDGLAAGMHKSLT